MTGLEQQIMNQARPVIDRAVDEKIQEIVQIAKMRWQDRVSRRITEAQWAVQQGRIYDPNHALMKTYDAYRWVAEHVELDVHIARDATGAQITLTAQTNDDSAIDDFRKERIAECVGDLTNQIGYDYF